MARRPRHALTALPHHVLLRGHNRQPVFVDEVDYRQYLTWLHESALAHGLLVHAYLLMDAQVQMIATPEREDALSRAIQDVGRRYVRWFNRRHGRSGTLWDGRFRSSLLEAHCWLLACQRHLESGPVRAGRAGSPADWLWSSHRHHAGLAVDPLVRPHPTVWALGNTPFERESAYRRLFDEPVSQTDDDWLIACVLGGKPTASADFQRRLEASLGLRLLSRPVGRPRRTPAADDGSAR